MSILISTAQSHQADLIARLARQSFEEAFAIDNDPQDMAAYMEVAFAPEMIREEFQSNLNTYFLGEYGDNPYGFAKLRRGSKPPEILADKTSIEVQRLYVIEEGHGKGLGKALMEACLSMAGSEGIEYIWLGVWEHNPRAIRFYRKMGFEVCGSHDFVLGRDVQTDLEMFRKV